MNVTLCVNLADNVGIDIKLRIKGGLYWQVDTDKGTFLTGQINLTFKDFFISKMELETENRNKTAPNKKYQAIQLRG